MKFIPNNYFSKLLDALNEGKINVGFRSLNTEEYKNFIAAFPASKISSLTFEQYCIGKNNNNSFCWWIERGLQPVLGRYSPGMNDKLVRLKAKIAYFRIIFRHGFFITY